MNFHDRYIYDDGFLISKHTNDVMCNLDKDGYIRVRINGAEFRAHRVIWEMHNGPIPEGTLIDHIDGNKCNNRLSNLRLATRRQNNVNSKVKSNRIYDLPKGVTMNTGGKFRAKIKYKGDTICIGTYNSIEEAEREYNDAAKILNNEFAPQ
jgi:hypothetical protein